MALTLLIGAARSGKTAVAARLAERPGRPVVYIATGEVGDDEMAERIRRHRDARPSGWETVEEPVALEDAIGGTPSDVSLIVDCLTLWVSNLLDRGVVPEEIEERAAKAAALASGRPGPVVAVTNEVGAGIVPANPLARSFRDLHGRVNTAWAEVADRAYLVVAGRALTLRRLEDLDDG